MKFIDNAVIDNAVIENISKILADELTGSKITKMFYEIGLCNFDANKPFTSTKWRRINESVLYKCKMDNSAKPLFKTIEYVAKPQNYIKSPKEWSNLLININEQLIFYGYKLNDSGKIEKTQVANSFKDAQERLKSLNSKLKDLKIHPEVLKFCNKELINENYFHAILEASKSVVERVKQISELDVDGNRLINQAFDYKHPIILIRKNYLTTEAQRGEYKGLKALLNAIIFFYRNPKAHDPKIYNDESLDDAVTAFTLMSLAQNKLDNCINVRDLDN